MTCHIGLRLYYSFHIDFIHVRFVPPEINRSDTWPIHQNPDSDPLEHVKIPRVRFEEEHTSSETAKLSRLSSKYKSHSQKSSSSKMATPTDSSPTINPPPAFDIVQTYRRLLASDPDITMPVAAIEALVEALASSSASTISETLSLLSQHTATLKEAIANPISLSAGTDLFQRYLITTLNRPGSSLGPSGDFRAIRNHLLSSGRLFVERAKASREKIASFGRHFVRDGTTVLTNGGSRVVGALLRSAAEAGGGRGSIRFRVIYVLSQNSAPHDPYAAQAQKGGEGEGSGEGTAIVAMLRARGVPVATIPDSAVAYSLGKVDMVIVGAEGVVENGGIISRMGTYQIGMLAKAKGKPFYVVAESHKFVRLYPLSQYDLPIEQNVIEFKVDEETDGVTGEGTKQADEAVEDEGVEMGGTDAETGGTADPVRSKCSGGSPEDAVDFTVSYISSLRISKLRQSSERGRCINGIGQSADWALFGRSGCYEEPYCTYLRALGSHHVRRNFGCPVAGSCLYASRLLHFLSTYVSSYKPSIMLPLPIHIC